MGEVKKFHFSSNVPQLPIPKFLTTTTHKTLALILLSIIGTFSIYKNIYWLGYFNDDAYYYFAGKSLAENGSYSDTFSVKEKPFTRYPPGYPLIISIFTFLPNSIFFIRILNLLFLICAYLIFWKIIENNGYNLGKVFYYVTAACPSLSTFVPAIMPELFFLLISLIVLYLLDKKQRYNFFLIGILISLSYYVKPIGIVLFISAVVYFLMKKQWKGILIVSTLFALFFFYWNFYLYSLKVKSSHFSQFIVTISEFNFETKIFLKSLVDNLSFYSFVVIIESFFPLFQEITKPIQIFLYLIFGIAFFSLIREKRILSFGIYFLFYFLLIIYWRGHDLRYLTGVIPIVLFFLWKNLNTKTLKIFYTTVYFISTFFYISFIIKKNTASPYYLEWIKNNTYKDTVVFCIDQGRTFAITQRKTENIFFDNLERLVLKLKDYPDSLFVLIKPYKIISPRISSEIYLWQAIYNRMKFRLHTKIFKKLYSDSDVEIFKPQLTEKIFLDLSKFEQSINLFNLKKLDEAKKILLDLINTNTQLTQPYYNLTTYYFAEKRYKDAIEVLKKGLEISPYSDSFNFLLGLAYLKINDKKLAKKYLQIAEDIANKSGNFKLEKEIGLRLKRLR